MKIKIPTNCPECGSILVKINDQLFCQNKTCPAQINKKIEHFAKILDIKGLGEKTIEKLNLTSLPSLYYLTIGMLTEIVGQKTAIKLIDNIERSKASTFAKVLTSMSIPLIGNTASTKLATMVNGFDEITSELCVKAGLGEKATNNLLNWLSTDYQEIKLFLPFTFEKNNKTEKEILGVVCITGKLKSYKNKAEASKDLQDLGYKVVDTLTKEVSILIDEEDKGSTKRIAAEKRGLKIITNLNQLIKEIK